MRTPGSTWATHSLGSFSSTNTTGGLTRRPLPFTDFGVPSPLELDITFSLASISFPHALGVVELELPVRRNDHLKRSDSASDSFELCLSRL
uniref:40S ribosomal protein S27 n=1 Tax=Rhizophora mucronata TaxID=61149 RepID=A0A2P2KTY8_RHIMU